MSLDIYNGNKWLVFNIQDFKKLRDYRVTQSDFQTCKRLFASGDELEFIRRNFENLPCRKSGICTWHGEMAQFIFDNI